MIKVHQRIESSNFLKDIKNKDTLVISLIDCNFELNLKFMIMIDVRLNLYLSCLLNKTKLAKRHIWNEKT